MGDVVCIVGPTGLGKTALINDVELFANKNTPSRRKVLINGLISSKEPLVLRGSCPRLGSARYAWESRR